VFSSGLVLHGLLAHHVHHADRDLRSYLNNNKPTPLRVQVITVAHLLSFSQQAAEGFNYLTSKGFVHR
jgi:hypothetical protein